VPHKNRIVLGDNLAFLRDLPDGIVDLIYIDPPFNTGKQQTRRNVKSVRDDEGGSTGFKGQRYRSEEGESTGYSDSFDDFQAFLEPRLREAHRLLKPNGSFFLHIDYREVHYAKVWLDGIFGRDHFQNEIIWAYDYGGRSKSRWPAKHDNILWYTRHAKDFTFHHDAMDRIPYMAPGLVGKEKAARGKTPTDVWWHTICSPTGKEKTGYATQKPVGVLKRFINVHSSPGDLVLDFFAGSGTTGQAAGDLDRHFWLVDQNPQATEIMRARLAAFDPIFEELSSDEGE
jgi:site-specific DNA-methyltransferase (adenine-specific)